MAKIEIDNKKMWESLRKAMWYFPEAEWLTRSIDTALSEQGLTVNDKGEITTIEPEVKWYVALNNYGYYENALLGRVPLFLKGERTTKENVFKMSYDEMGINITEEEFNKLFRPATEEPEQPNKCLFTKDLYTDEERKELCEGCQEECELNKDIEPKERKVSSILKNMLDNINEESLAKTREEMQKTPEIAEFDKAIETLIGNIDGDYCVHISSYDDYINKFAPQILAAARKLIASKLESMVDTMVSQNGGMCVHYREGVEDVINKIKGESV